MFKRSKKINTLIIMEIIQQCKNKADNIIKQASELIEGIHVSNIDQPQLVYTQSKIQKSNKCIVCNKQNPKYVCPKCEIKYCGVQHFKSHNLFCSEQFYREQVQNYLKGLKVQKNCLIQTQKILNDHKQLIRSEELNMVGEHQLAQKRLVEIFQEIQKNQLVNLSTAEQTSINQFIKNTTSGVQEYATKQPFWEIQDGLCYYFLQQLQIQNYSTCQNPDLIQYRILMSQRIAKNDLISNVDYICNKNKSPLIMLQVLHFCFIGVLLYRIYDGQLELKQSVFILLKVYELQTIKNNSQLTVSQIVQLLLDQIREKINQIHDGFQNWCNIGYYDLIKVLKNKFLCIQMLLRIKDACKTYQEEQKSSRCLKIIKKLEFLFITVKHLKFYEVKIIQQSIKKHICFEDKINQNIKCVNNLKISKNTILMPHKQ